MGVRVRLSRNTSMYLPFWVAIPVWLIWAGIVACFFGVLLAAWHGFTPSDSTPHEQFESILQRASIRGLRTEIEGLYYRKETAAIGDPDRPAPRWRFTTEALSELDTVRLLAVVGAVISEFDRVAGRLMSQSKERFSRIDRHRAEANFRWAISVPIAALSTTAWFMSGHFASWLWLTLAAGGLVVAFALLLLGSQSEQIANTTVIYSLLLREVESWWSPRRSKGCVCS